jgi:hypothetical protein
MKTDERGSIIAWATSEDGTENRDVSVLTLFSNDLDKIDIHDGAVSKMMESIIYEEGSMDWALGGN